MRVRHGRGEFQNGSGIRYITTPLFEARIVSVCMCGDDERTVTRFVGFGQGGKGNLPPPQWLREMKRNDVVPVLNRRGMYCWDKYTRRNN